MNITKIIALEEVATDLDNGEQFYDSQEPGTGTYFRDSIVADIESFQPYAGIHAKHHGLYRMLSVRFPYAVYYTLKADVAVVVAVLDMRRNPASIRGKLNSRKS